MPPAQGLFRELVTGVAEHRQHVGLGVPEGVAVVAGPGQALGRDGAPLAPRRGLENVEQREAQRLLDLGVAVELDVGAVPEGVQVLALGPGEPVPALGHRVLEASVDLVAQELDRLLRGPVVGQELDHAQRLAGLEPGRDGHAAEVGLGLGQRGRVLDLQQVLHPGRHRQPAAPRPVREHDAQVVVDRELALQRAVERLAAARVVVARPVALVGEQARVDGDAQRLVDGLDLVGDGRDRARVEGHEPARRHLDRHAALRAPVQRARQRAGAEVELALVVVQVPAVDVQRLVLDQQPDELAVGHVDHALAVLRVAVGALAVAQRDRLVEAVEIGAAEGARLALVEVAAQAQVAVGDGEERLGLGQEVEVELGLAQAPGLGRVGVVVDHSSSPRSSTTTSAPCCLSASAWPTRSTPTT